MLHAGSFADLYDLQENSRWAGRVRVDRRQPLPVTHHGAFNKWCISDLRRITAVPLAGSIVLPRDEAFRY